MKKLSFNKNFLFDLIRSAIIAVLISLALVLVFALIVNLTEVPDVLIAPVNQVIKILSVLVGCLIGIKEKRRGAFKGAIVGLSYTLLSILIFGLISNSVRFNAMSLIDVALGIVIGAISGVIAVNVGKKSLSRVQK
ncbi:MAG: TIGR04086 family membrane protein [Clostridia bacterium]|nr:TIGR04086 family membrane protein [Clostridia bacterium]